jgi:hypothetical protein
MNNFFNSFSTISFKNSLSRQLNILKLTALHVFTFGYNLYTHFNAHAISFKTAWPPGTKMHHGNLSG